MAAVNVKHFLNEKFRLKQCEACLKWRGIPQSLFKPEFDNGFRCTYIKPLATMGGCYAPEDCVELDQAAANLHEKETSNAKKSKEKAKPFSLMDNIKDEDKDDDNDNDDNH